MTAKKTDRAGTTRAATVAVLLAAGAGSRFRDIRHTGSHKLLAELNPAGRTVIAQSLSTLVDARIGPIVVVTGALDAERLAADAEVAELFAHPTVTTRHNPAWAAGQITSLHAGIEVARRIGADAVVVGLADQPFITPEGWRTVAAGLGPITVATYDGRRGNPVRLHADVWDRLPHDGDVGARTLMQQHPGLVTEVSCSGSSADIDTLEDLHRWQSN